MLYNSYTLLLNKTRLSFDVLAVGTVVDDVFVILAVLLIGLHHALLFCYCSKEALDMIIREIEMSMFSLITLEIYNRLVTF